MKVIFRHILHLVLKWTARAVLHKHRPFVVAVAGSVGKTTTKDLIHHVLEAEYSCWKSESSYNNEIGVPLAVFGTRSGKRNILAWFGIFARAIRLMFGGEYPSHLILEFGSDKPGDTAYLTSIVRPDIAVVTRVGEAHMEFYKTLEAAQADTADLVASLRKEGVAVLNADDPGVLAMRHRTASRVVTYGIAQEADLRAEGLRLEQPADGRAFAGGSIVFSFLVNTLSGTVPCVLPGSIGRPQVYASLAAFAVAEACGMQHQEIVDRITSFTPPPGRLRVLPGRNKSIIVDDSYNASPEAVIEGLRTISLIRAHRRIAVLGDMLELGTLAQSAHRRVGKFVPDSGIGELWCVGDLARIIGEEADKSGFPHNQIFYETTAAVVGQRLAERIRYGDVVFVKGSQNVRLERVVAALLGPSVRAADVLVRQDASWLSK